MAAAPGWYPDTERPGGLRYWDGAAWTEYRQGPAPAPVAFVRVASPANRNIVALVAVGAGAGIILIGSALPWATLRAGFFSVSKAGTDGDGVLTILGAFVIGGLLVPAAVSSHRLVGVWISVLVVACLVALVVVIDGADLVHRFAQVNSDPNTTVRAHVGVGLIMVGIGAAAAIAGSLFGIVRPNAPGA